MKSTTKALAVLPWFVIASAAMIAIPGCDTDDGFEEVGEEIDEAADDLDDALD